MNKEVIKLTEEIGKVYVEISKLKSKREVLDARIWDAKRREIDKDLSTTPSRKKAKKRFKK